MFFIDLLTQPIVSLIIAIIATIGIPVVTYMIKRWGPLIQPTRFDFIPLIVALFTIALFRLLIASTNIGLGDFSSTLAPMARVRDITLLVAVIALTRRSVQLLFKQGKSWIAATFLR